VIPIFIFLGIFLGLFLYYAEYNSRSQPTCGE